MKADLAKREPQWLERWEKAGLYEKILERNAASGARRFVFHDGPPYANGDMHYGHVLNNSLKDFVTRSRNQLGEPTLFVPGWDCHGLPIELNVDKALGPKKRDMTATQVREACTREANKWVGVQREQRKRLGVLGTWGEPYLTMNPRFEGSIVRALGHFARRGLVYRGKKPVQWCPKDRTALAESEVEYIEEHTSPSVYVAFGVAEKSLKKLKGLFASTRARAFAAVIWTTTPWTLPANLAIAVHPEVDYVLLDVTQGDTVRGLLVAEALVDAVTKALRLAEGSHAHGASVKGSELEGLFFRHPFEDRDSAIVLADYVDTETGTGLVHTAPGHGRDDYNTGLRHKLDAYAPLDDAGRYTDELGEGSKKLGLQGKTVWEANPIVVAALATSGALLNRAGDSVVHKYPGCWRCHQPLITRATTQWFIALDAPMKGDAKGRSLRALALDEIDRLARAGEASQAKIEKGASGREADAHGWVPAWGRERIHGMIANRPDWCISRQRVWGVPIPALHCQGCGHATLDEALLAHVAGVFDAQGAGAWYDENATVVPDGFACEKCGATGPFVRDASIVDVWFESGSSFYAVCDGHEARGLGLPVDLYLEGSDQHRGWFHSSLLVGAAILGRAPFEAVVTHGFITEKRKVTVNGREVERNFAISKSEIAQRKAAGDDVSHLDPLAVIKRDGAEILRLWSASEDYSGDVGLSKAAIAQVTDLYRKIRNAWRFMLQVLRKKAPERVPASELLPFDRAVLARLGALVPECEARYRRYDFRGVLGQLVEFLGDLSAFYLDVCKDWLYNDAEESVRRRSSLTTIETVLRATAQVLAPILPFTAEDVWDHLPKREGDAESVHLAGWPSVPVPDDAHAVVDAVRTVRALRDRVNLAMEPLVQAWGVERQAAKRENREAGDGATKIAEDHRIDDRRDAIVWAEVTSDERAALAPLSGVLSECLIVGQLELVEPDSAGSLGARVRRASSPACPRCWRRKSDAGAGAEGLCPRCDEAVRAYDAAMSAS